MKHKKHSKTWGFTESAFMWVAKWNCFLAGTMLKSPAITHANLLLNWLITAANTGIISSQLSCLFYYLWLALVKYGVVTGRNSFAQCFYAFSCLLLRMQTLWLFHQKTVLRKFRVNVGKVTELKGWHSLEFLNRNGSGLAVGRGVCLANIIFFILLACFVMFSKEVLKCILYKVRQCSVTADSRSLTEGDQSQVCHLLLCDLEQVT